MTKNDKQVYVKDLKDKFSRADAFFLVSNQGVIANKMNDLRKEIKDNGGEFKIIKNTLVKRAISEFTYNDDFKTFLNGPVGLAFSYSDPVAIAKILTKAMDDGLKMDFTVGYLNESKLEKTQIEALAKLPSREELLGQLLRVMVGPIRNLVGVLSAVPRDFVGVLNAIKNNKE